MVKVTDGAYLRFPHLHGGSVCFVCEDDLWLAPLPDRGGRTRRAWRLTADRTRLGPPRFSPDGSLIAFTGWRSLDPEVYAVPAGGGQARRLTYWGGPDARVCGWSPQGRVLAVSSHAQPFAHYAWAYGVDTDGSPGERLPYGRVSDLAVAGRGARRRTLLLSGTPPQEPAAWKRYRGGATGRLWLDGERLLPDLAGHLASPMLVGGRVAFLSDHEGVGNLYSCRADGSDLRRHTDHADFYARAASTDGRRVVYQCAGELWLAGDLADPAAVPRRLAVAPAGPRSGRRPHAVPAAANVTGLACDTTGRASAVCVRGSLYWLTHRDGPARTLADQPGARVRLPEMLGGTGRIAFVTDADGEDAVEIAALPGRAAAGRPAGDPAAEADGFPAGPAGGLPPPPQAPPPQAAHAASAPPARHHDRPAHRGSGAPAGGGGRSREPAAERLPAPDAPGAGSGGVAVGGFPPVAPGGRRLAGGRLGRVLELVASPDGTLLAVASHDGRLLMVGTGEDGAGGEAAGGGAVPAGEGAVTELARSANGPVRDLAFSPDSARLAWSHPGVGRSLRKIRMARLADGTVTDVTAGRFEDEQPVFTRDGRYLAFLSWRGFDPVYDVHTGDLSFPLGCRPHLVPLNSATPSPFDLPVEGRPPGGGLDPAADGAGGPVVVEAAGLAERVTPFPVPASKYSSLEAVHGGLVWLRWPVSGALGETFANPADPSARPTLEFFDLARSRRTDLLRHLDWFEVSGDGTRLVVHDEGELAVLPAAERADEDTAVVLDMRRILHEVDPAAEWRQAYREAGRVVRDLFWAPDLGGIDWDAVLEQYRPLVDRVASPEEFADLLREVLGELGTSHAYCVPARRNEGPAHYQRPIGLLGADFAPDASGAWRVTRVLPGESSDPRARSPLAGTGIGTGFALTHVDGRPVDPVAGPAPLLAGAGGTTVELTFTPPPGDRSAGHPRRVAVAPLIEDRPLRYHAWVAERRSAVHELSGGRCGYLHIPDMGGSGWAQFNRDLRLEVARPSLIVDVRGNAGGNISELVVERLSRTVLGWDVSRDAQPVPYTTNAPRGPVVALADEATASDGDMITAAFRLLGLGPVVGTRTWGGVVGTSGRHRLGDGTVITVPMNAAWLDGYGWGVENAGVPPDIEVPRAAPGRPQERTRQLAIAVETALGLLDRRPPSAPPDARSRPGLTRPPLPPRPAHG